MRVYNTLYFLHLLLLNSFFFFKLQPDKVKFELRLGQSKPIYNAFKAIQESPEWQTLSDAQKRIVDCEYTFVMEMFCSFCSMWVVNLMAGNWYITKTKILILLCFDLLVLLCPWTMPPSGLVMLESHGNRFVFARNIPLLPINLVCIGFYHLLCNGLIYS